MILAWACWGRSRREAQLRLDAVPASSRQLPRLAVGERARCPPRGLSWAACAFAPWQWRPSAHSEGEGESPRASGALIWTPCTFMSTARCSCRCLDAACLHGHGVLFQVLSLLGGAGRSTLHLSKGGVLKHHEPTSKHYSTLDGSQQGKEVRGTPSCSTRKEVII